MRDIDFEELDKAVNNYIGNDSVKESEEAKATVHPASDFHDNSAKPVRRSGRFMDIMPSRAPARLKKTTDETKINGDADIVDDFKEKADIERHQAKPQVIKDSLEAEGSVSVPEVSYEDPMLESVNVENDLSQADQEENKVEAETVAASLDAATVPVEPVSDIEAKPTEPILEEMKPEPSEKLDDEIIMPSEPGVFQIDQEADDIKTFSDDQAGHNLDNTSVLPKPTSSEEIIKRDADEVTPETDKTPEVDHLPDNNKISKQDTAKDDEQPLVTPFIPNAKVEKRPLGVAHGNQLSHSDRATTPNRTKPSSAKADKSAVPILNNEDYAKPIKKHKKKSGWSIVLAIALLIGLGAGAGALAYYLLMV